jgi:hypothetical protein
MRLIPVTHVLKPRKKIKPRYSSPTIFLKSEAGKSSASIQWKRSNRYWYDEYKGFTGIAISAAEVLKILYVPKSCIYMNPYCFVHLKGQDPLN